MGLNTLPNGCPPARKNTRLCFATGLISALFSSLPAMAKNALIKIDDKEVTYPVMTGSEGEQAIDARNLRKDTGYIFYDQGYGNTG